MTNIGAGNNISYNTYKYYVALDEFVLYRSQVIGAERKREQQVFETIAEEEDDEVGSQTSLVHRGGRRGGGRSDSSSLDLERSFSTNALKIAADIRNRLSLNVTAMSVDADGD